MGVVALTFSWGAYLVGVWLGALCAALFTSAVLVLRHGSRHAARHVGPSRDLFEKPARGPAHPALSEEVRRALLEELPEWAKDPDVDRTRWLNQLIHGMWPYLSASIEQTVLDSVDAAIEAMRGGGGTQAEPEEGGTGDGGAAVDGTSPSETGVTTAAPTEGAAAAAPAVDGSGEPSNEDVKPAGGSFLDYFDVLGFQRFSLGSVPLAVTGIKTQRTSADEVVLEVAITWGSSMMAHFVASAFGLSLNVVLSGLQLHTNVRVSIWPLTQRIPCMGGMMISLMDVPRLDASLQVAGFDIMAVPGVSALVRWALGKYVLEGFMLFPASLHIPIEENGGLPPPPQGILYCTLESAHVDKNQFKRAVPDFYARMWRTPARVVTSRTIMNSYSPVWQDKTEFIVENAEKESFTVQLLNRDVGKKHVGQLVIPIKDLEPNQEVVIDRELGEMKKKDGSFGFVDGSSIKLRLMYAPFSEESGDAALDLGEDEDGDPVKMGLLTVSVKSAMHLVSADANGKSDPYVVVECGRKKEKTSIKDKTLRPVWNEQFMFFSIKTTQTVKFTVFDHDKLGDDELGHFEVSVKDVYADGVLKNAFILEGVKHGVLMAELRFAAYAR